MIATDIAQDGGNVSEQSEEYDLNTLFFEDGDDDILTADSAEVYLILTAVFIPYVMMQFSFSLSNVDGLKFQSTLYIFS